MLNECKMKRRCFFSWPNELLFNRARQVTVSYSPISHPDNSLSAAALQLIKFT
jgi:hypothetical protein